MMKLSQRQSKLGSYLTVALGAGAAATSAEAATVFYSSGATGTPWQAVNYLGAFALKSSGYVTLALNGSYQRFFRESQVATGVSLVNTSYNEYFIYNVSGGFIGGAQSGDDNYVTYDTNADYIYDSVARFSFNGGLGGYLMAVSQDMAGLTFATGVSNILAGSVAATPEPAGFLLGGVPALIGAGALLRRRVRPGAALGLMALGAEGVRARRESAAAA